MPESITDGCSPSPTHASPRASSLSQRARIRPLFLPKAHSCNAMAQLQLRPLMSRRAIRLLPGLHSCLTDGLPWVSNSLHNLHPSSTSSPSAIAGMHTTQRPRLLRRWDVHACVHVHMRNSRADCGCFGPDFDTSGPNRVSAAVVVW